MSIKLPHQHSLRVQRHMSRMQVTMHFMSVINLMPYMLPWVLVQHYMLDRLSCWLLQGHGQQQMQPL